MTGKACSQAPAGGAVAGFQEMVTEAEVSANTGSAAVAAIPPGAVGAAGTDAVAGSEAGLAPASLWAVTVYE